MPTGSWAGWLPRNDERPPVCPQPVARRVSSCLQHFYVLQCGLEEKGWAGSGLTRLRLTDGNDQAISWRLGGSQTSLGTSGWQRVQLATGWRGFLIWGAGEERASSDPTIEWEVSVLGVCLPACLPLCCSEGGRGWACSCLGRAAPAWDTAPLSGYRLNASLPTHFNSQRGASGQPLLSKKIVEVSFSRWSCRAFGRCSRNGPGWGEPPEGCGELRLGVRGPVLHPKLGGGGGGGAAGPRCPPVLGSSLQGGAQTQPWG